MASFGYHEKITSVAKVTKQMSLLIDDEVSRGSEDDDG